MPTPLTRRDALALGATGAAALIARPAAALAPAEAERFIRALIDEATEIVRRDARQGARADEFLRFLREKAALDAIARFTMGVNWRQMDPAQQARFVSAFENYAARVYAARVGEYSGQVIEVVGSQDVGRKGVLVRSLLKSPSAADITVEWLVDDRSGRPQLVDLIAEGVSLSISQREEFAAMVERRGGDIDRFIADLDGLGA